MSNDGKRLESLVAFVEQTLLPQGFEVKTNERVFNDEGVKIAEFDVEVHGKIGSTTIAWLIECRDRPGQGPAPGSWIEQLVGRRIRFGFNKVTAVSTTGFAAGAIEFARDQGIELREVTALAPEHFSGWLKMQHIHHIERTTKLDHASILLGPNATQEHLDAVREYLSAFDTNSNLLRSIKNGETTTLSNAFLGVVNTRSDLFDGIEPNGPGRKVTLHVQYTNDSDHFVLDTASGPIRVSEIVYYGELSIQERLVPLTITADYVHSESKESISQIASFAPQNVQGMQLSIELHRLTSTGETHIMLRRLSDNA